MIFVPEESQARKQVVRKAVTERAIEIDPAIRLYYVEVEEPTLEHQLGDWDRIANELAARFDLPNVHLDPILLNELRRTVRKGDWKVTVTVWQDREAVRVQPGYAEEAYGLAVDIGSTTVAMHLCDLRTGEVLATASQMNPQVAYGEDLMSRVSYCDLNGARGWRRCTTRLSPRSIAWRSRPQRRRASRPGHHRYRVGRQQRDAPSPAATSPRTSWASRRSPRDQRCGGHQGGASWACGSRPACRPTCCRWRRATSARTTWA